MVESRTNVVEVALRNCFCATEMDGVEQALLRLSGVVSAQVDRTRAVVHLRYDTARTDMASLRAHVNGLGYRCDCVDCPDSRCQPGHPSIDAADVRTATQEPHENHAGHDGGAEHGGGSVRGAGRDEHGGGAEPGGGGHDEHAGHGADMVADMLRRFIVSAVLTVLIVLFSPVGHSVGFTVEPPFGLSTSWFGLILTTP